MDKLIEELNTQYPDSGWTIVIRGGMTDDDGDLVMDASIYTSWPHIASSDRYLGSPPSVAECINVHEIDEVLSELFNDLSSYDLKRSLRG